MTGLFKPEIREIHALCSAQNEEVFYDSNLSIETWFRNSLALFRCSLVKFEEGSSEVVCEQSSALMSRTKKTKQIQQRVSR